MIDNGIVAALAFWFFCIFVPFSIVEWIHFRRRR
jgi:hypothetical protein